MNTTHININSADYRLNHKPTPRTCEMCHEVPATRRVWAETRDGEIVTANVCEYCRDRGGWKGGR